MNRLTNVLAYPRALAAGTTMMLRVSTSNWTHGSRVYMSSSHAANSMVAVGPMCVCVCICAYKCIDMYTYYMHMYAYILRACPAATLQTGWSLWDLCVYMSIRVYMCMYTYYTYIYVDVCTSMYGIYTCTCTDIHAHVHIQNRRVRRRAARLTRRRLAFPRCARPCSRRARHTRRRVCLSRWRPFCSAHSQKSVPW